MYYLRVLQRSHSNLTSSRNNFFVKNVRESNCLRFFLQRCFLSITDFALLLSYYNTFKNMYITLFYFPSCQKALKMWMCECTTYRYSAARVYVFVDENILIDLEDQLINLILWKDCLFSGRLRGSLDSNYKRLRLRFLTFYFFFFVPIALFDQVNYEQCTDVLFTDPQIPLFSHFFIKNGSHNTIYTFKIILLQCFQFSVSVSAK